MKTSDCILVLDVGTSSLRGVMFDSTGHPIRQAFRKYSPTILGEDRVEQDSAVWSDGAAEVIRHCCSKRSDVAALALTAARSSLIAVDKSGTALGPAMMWQDRRSLSICEELQGGAEEVFASAGMRMDPIATAPKIAWVKRNNPALYRRAAKFVGIQDYLLRYLTGRFVTDHSFGSRTLLMNLESRRWDPALLNLFGVDESKLSDLVPPGTVCGKVSRDAAARTGLPSGTPVISAGGDQQCAAAGLGVIEPGRLAVNTGTGAYMVRGLAAPKIDPNRGLLCSAAAIPGMYVLEASVLAAGSLYNWFCGMMGTVGETRSAIIKSVDGLVARTPPGSNGVIMIPHVSGRGSPSWNPGATGSFHNLRLSSTAGDLARATLEGIAGELAENIEAMRNLANPETSIVSSGGMSVLKDYNQMLADAFGRPVERREFSQSTALGAWIVAAASMGLFETPLAAVESTINDGEAAEFLPSEAGMRIFADLIAAKRRIAAALGRIGEFPLGS